MNELVSTDLSLFELVWNASFLVQLVMLVLLVASFASWTMVFLKRAYINRERSAADAFEEQFWSGQDLVSIYNRINSPQLLRGGAGAHLPRRIPGVRQAQESEGAATCRGVRRHATGDARLAQPELERLDAHLPLLATIGSTSPYIGLFGTVWGIMNSFRALGNISQATLAHVAPGIAEALIATAMGLFAAIPAVIAYNRFASDVERLHNRYDNFIEEFSAILYRQMHG